MGIKVGAYSINTEHINQLAVQIQNTDDCEALILVIDQHLESLNDLLADIRDEASKIVTDILPIMKIPSPTPTAIVKWIKKVVVGSAGPQLEAYIKYTKQMIELAIAVTRLVVAIEQSQNTLEQCNVVERTLGLDKLRGEIDGMISNTLLQVDTFQQSILDIVDVEGQLNRIDVSSPEAFLRTVDDSYNQIGVRIKQIQDEPLEDL